MMTNTVNNSYADFKNEVLVAIDGALRGEDLSSLSERVIRTAAEDMRSSYPRAYSLADQERALGNFAAEQERRRDANTVKLEGGAIHYKALYDKAGAWKKLTRVPRLLEGVQAIVDPKAGTVRLFGTGAYGEDKSFDRTFKLGETVERDSYNLIYMGVIAKISAKLIRVEGTNLDRTTNMSIYDFARKNYNFDEMKARQRNAEWMD